MIATLWRVEYHSGDQDSDCYIAKEIRCGVDGMGALVDKATGNTLVGSLESLHKMFTEFHFKQLQSTKLPLGALEIWYLL